MASATPQRYDRRTIALHWLTAALVVFLWIGAHAIDTFPKGPLRVDARSVHIITGVGLLTILAWRIAWRRNGGTIIPRDTTRLDQIARMIHLLLYGLLIATIALGLLNAWVRGDSLFGLFKIPALGSYDPAARHALSERITGWHELGANAILVLAGGHAVMALVHHFGWHDGVLQRMLPDRGL
ncbi:MAG: cytochrome b [Sphingomonadales bacterium]|nr:cytochrome b [Sphingomonadales bacterium]